MHHLKRPLIRYLMHLHSGADVADSRAFTCFPGWPAWVLLRNSYPGYSRAQADELVVGKSVSGAQNAQPSTPSLTMRGIILPERLLH